MYSARSISAPHASRSDDVTAAHSPQAAPPAGGAPARHQAPSHVFLLPPPLPPSGDTGGPFPQCSLSRAATLLAPHFLPQRKAAEQRPRAAPAGAAPRPRGHVARRPLSQAVPCPALPCRPSAGRGKRNPRSMVVTAPEDAAAPGKWRRAASSVPAAPRRCPGAAPPLGARPLPPRPGGRDLRTAPVEPSRGRRDGVGGEAAPRGLGRTKERPGAAARSGRRGGPRRAHVERSGEQSSSVRREECRQRARSAPGAARRRKLRGGTDISAAPPVVCGAAGRVWGARCAGLPALGER